MIDNSLINAIFKQSGLARRREPDSPRRSPEKSLVSRPIVVCYENVLNNVTVITKTNAYVRTGIARVLGKADPTVRQEGLRTDCNEQEMSAWDSFTVHECF
jgi:hypothetical protein